MKCPNDSCLGTELVPFEDAVPKILECPTCGYRCDTRTESEQWDAFKQKVGAWSNHDVRETNTFRNEAGFRATGKCVKCGQDCVSSYDKQTKNRVRPGPCPKGPFANS